MTATFFIVSAEKVSKYIYLFTLLALIFDIGGGIGIKYLFSSLMLLWVVVLVGKYGVQKDLIVESSLLVFFLFSAWYALVRGVMPGEIYGQLSFVIYFGLLVVLYRVPRELSSELFVRVVTLGAVLIIGTFLSILIAPASAVVWGYIGDTYRLGYLGVQNVSGITFPNVYYRWSMWLIPGFILAFGRNRASAIVIGVAALLTLSTSIIVFSFLGAFMHSMFARSQPLHKIKMLLILAATVVIAILFANYSYDILFVVYEKILSKFSATSESTLIKLGHIEGVLASLRESIIVILFGTGPGSEFYSPGIHAYVINIEASHFNFVRQFGVVGGLAFFGYIFFVIGKSFSTDVLGRRWATGLLMLFIAAGTNPLLMSPVFVVVLMLVRANCWTVGTDIRHVA